MIFWFVNNNKCLTRCCQYSGNIEKCDTFSIAHIVKIKRILCSFLSFHFFF